MKKLPTGGEYKTRTPHQKWEFSQLRIF